MGGSLERVVVMKQTAIIGTWLCNVIQEVNINVQRTRRCDTNYSVMFMSSYKSLYEQAHKLGCMGLQI